MVMIVVFVQGIRLDEVDDTQLKTRARAGRRRVVRTVVATQHRPSALVLESRVNTGDTPSAWTVNARPPIVLYTARLIVMSGVSQHNQAFVDAALERQRSIGRTTRLQAAAAAEYTSTPCSDSTTTTKKNRPPKVDTDADGVVWVLRSLVDAEVHVLRGACRCHCRDWSKVRLMLRHEACEKDHSGTLARMVSDTTFAGTVVLGIADPPSPNIESETIVGVEDDVYGFLPAGIHSNALISDCVLEPHCRVYRNTVLSKSHVGESALVVNCGLVSCSGDWTDRMTISVGPESGGGRQVQVSVESTMMDVCRSLGMSRDEGPLMTDALPPTPPCPYNIIGRSSLVRDTPTLKNVYMAANSSIVAATAVGDVTLLSHGRIGNGCTVSNALLQWNAVIDDHSSVTNCMLMEQAHMGPHSLVTSSVLGPDVHVSAGEIHSSVLGPNINAHHQSLVIGVLWPLGRGNVGYGANVGSNHTGRLPDQETAAGEGTFWGLSTCIKFPVDLSWAPYSIVAAGTTLNPSQRVMMPFSLMVETDGVNHILPGWVLYSSPYTLSRSDVKFAERRKAERHKCYTGWKIIRPSTVDMCVAARHALQSTGSKENVYKTDRDVIGIGRNHLTERARVAGIEAYTKCIQRYALQGLLQWLEHQAPSRTPSAESVVLLRHKLTSGGMRVLPTAASLKQVRWPTLPWDDGQGWTARWHHCLAIMSVEFSLQGDPMTWTTNLLWKLVALEQDYAQRVCDCKKRDDTRGSKTIPGYASAHVAADDDSVIVAANEFAQQTEAAVNRILGVSDTSRRNSRL